MNIVFSIAEILCNSTKKGGLPKATHLAIITVVLLFETYPIHGHILAFNQLNKHIVNAFRVLCLCASCL